jgi:hypothetical protein
MYFSNSDKTQRNADHIVDSFNKKLIGNSRWGVDQKGMNGN